MGGAPGHEQADAHGDELRARGGAAHRAAEHAVRRDDAGDVGAVLAGHDADVDGLVLAIDLDDEWHPLGDRGCRVVRAEVADVAIHLVVRHRGFVREGQVLIDVHPDLAAAVPEDAEVAARAGGVAVAVDVVADLAPEVGMALVEHAEAEATGAWGRVGDAARREARAAHHVRQDPGRITIVGRMRCR